MNNITIEGKKGYFAPLTMTGKTNFHIFSPTLSLLNKGTILVNDIFVSCFASVQNHHLAQIFMAPFRWYYQFSRLISINEPFANNQQDGMHWAIEIFYRFVSYIQPSVLQLS